MRLIEVADGCLVGVGTVLESSDSLDRLRFARSDRPLTRIRFFRHESVSGSGSHFSLIHGSDRLRPNGRDSRRAVRTLLSRISRCAASDRKRFARTDSGAGNASVRRDGQKGARDDSATNG